MQTIPSLRLALLLAVVGAGLSACTTVPQRPLWEKSGSDNATTNSDTVQCQLAAQRQASRLYPYGSSNPTLGGAGMVAAQQQANIDRDSAQLQMFNDCMAGKGYKQPPEPDADDKQ